MKMRNFLTKILIVLFPVFLTIHATAQEKVDTTQKKIRIRNNQFKNAIGIKISLESFPLGITYRHYFGNIVLEANMMVSHNWAEFRLTNEFLVLYQFNSRHRFQPYVGGGIRTIYLNPTDQAENNPIFFEIKEKNKEYFYPKVLLVAGVELLPKKWRIAYFFDMSFNVDFFDRSPIYSYLSASIGVRYRFTKNKKQ